MILTQKALLLFILISLINRLPKNKASLLFTKSSISLIDESSIKLLYLKIPLKINATANARFSHSLSDNSS